MKLFIEYELYIKDSKGRLLNCLKKAEADVLPRKGEKISYYTKHDDQFRRYTVTEVIHNLDGSQMPEVIAEFCPAPKAKPKHRRRPNLSTKKKYSRLERRAKYLPPRVPRIKIYE